jgi:hypothetical protein
MLRVLQIEYTMEVEKMPKRKKKSIKENGFLKIESYTEENLYSDDDESKDKSKN